MTPTPSARPIDASTSWLMLEDEPVEKRLSAVIAMVLGMDRECVQPQGSLKELGGSEQIAMALSRACLDAGMDVKADDILRCETIAELQTFVTPCARQSRPIEVAELENVPSLEGLRAAHLSAADINSRHSRNSSYASTISQGGATTELEMALGARHVIGRIATVRPKAGLLEGRRVALLTLAGIAPAEGKPSTINLVPQSQALFAGTQVTMLRETAASVLPPDDVLDVWIVLDGMSVTESVDIDIRSL